MKTFRLIFYETLMAVCLTTTVVACKDNANENSEKSNSNSSVSTAKTRGGGVETPIDDITDTNSGEDSDSISQEEAQVDVNGTKRKALLIGVGRYPYYNGNDDASWEPLGSADDLELLKGKLHSLGFVVKDIVDEAATFDGIIAKLVDFEKNVCEEGDTVLLHFSGHGQLKIDEYGDEKDGYTECFIPYNAERVCSKDPNGYRGKYHLTDDTIHEHINAIRKKIGKNGYLLVTFDACHSGDMNRTAGNIEDVFGENILTRAKHKVVVDKESKEYAQFVSLSSCESREKSTEKLVGKKSYGVLSYNLSLRLDDMKLGKITFEKLADEVKMQWTEASQHPVISKFGDYMK